MCAWYEVHSAQSRHSVGHLEVEDGLIVKTSPAYRWAVGLDFDQQHKKWSEGGYTVVKSRRRSPSLDSTAKYKKPKPSTRELARRVSP